MKKSLKTCALLGYILFSGASFATDLVCDVYAKSAGGQSSNGLAFCDAIDYSYGNSTSGRFYLINITKPIYQVIWNGHASSCQGGTSCSVKVKAYKPGQKATATILYKDGTYETTNTSRMYYETGH